MQKMKKGPISKLLFVQVGKRTKETVRGGGPLGMARMKTMDKAQLRGRMSSGPVKKKKKKTGRGGSTP